MTNTEIHQPSRFYTPNRRRARRKGSSLTAAVRVAVSVIVAVPVIVKVKFWTKKTIQLILLQKQVYLSVYPHFC